MNVNIDKEGTIIILTGAGISRESGLDTFRCEGGIWSKVNLEDVATPEAFQRDPKLVQDFYNARRQQLYKDRPEPNPAHLALARWACWKQSSRKISMIYMNVPAAQTSFICMASC